MRKHLLVLAAVVAALATAGTAAAAGGAGAVVVNDAGCTTNVFATTCIVVKTTTNTTVTPSGKISYVTNGTVERKMTFFFGATYTSTSAIHLHNLRDGDELQEESHHYSEQTEYVSGTYALTCIQSFDLHWANGAAQPGQFELSCTTP